MKHLAFFALLALSSPLATQADEPPVPKQPLPLVETFRQRALAYLKSNRPDIKSDQLQLSGVTYSYKSEPAPHSSDPFQEFVTIAFLDPSSRTESPRPGGGKTITTHFITVSVRTTTPESISIGPDSSTSEVSQ